MQYREMTEFLENDPSFDKLKIKTKIHGCNYN